MRKLGTLLLAVSMILAFAGVAISHTSNGCGSRPVIHPDATPSWFGDASDECPGEAHNIDDDSSYNARSGDDAVYAGDEADELRGEFGNDKLVGEDGPDYLSGGAGNDHLFEQTETIDSCGTSEDELQGGDGNDVIWGGCGHDIIGAGAGATDQLFHCHDGITDDVGSGFEDHEHIFGAACD